MFYIVFIKRRRKSMKEEIKENKKDKNTIGEIIKNKNIETYKKLEEMAKEK